MEEIPNDEKISHKPEEIESEKVLELFSLSETQVEDLRNRIEEHHGLIRVFVHPQTNYKGDIPNLEKSREIFFRCIGKKHSPPIIVLEDERQNHPLLQTMRIVKEKYNNEPPNPIYTVETVADNTYLNSNIDGQKNNKEDSTYREEVQRNLMRFFVLLSKFGVKKILVGGTRLDINDQGEVDRCVGNFIFTLDHLKKHAKAHGGEFDIEIKLSEGTAGFRRSDLRDIRPDLI